MIALNQTPPDKLVDASGQPYFVWDRRMTLEEFRTGLAHADVSVRARFLGRVMRDARPDDALQFATPAEMAAAWSDVAPFLGAKREFWRWLLETWGELEPVRP